MVDDAIYKKLNLALADHKTQNVVIFNAYVESQ